MRNDIKTKMILTPTEYAALRGISHSAVAKQIRRNKHQIGVASVEQYGRFYLLNMEVDYLDKIKFKNKL